MTTMTLEKPTTCEVTGHEPTRNAPMYQPNVDIIERENELEVLADMPGTKPDDIEIKFENGSLTLHAKVGQRQRSETGYLLREFGVGDFRRSFQVGEDIDTERIHAAYSDGVLTLRLPKTEAARPRRIEVEAK